jgi:hypothetical protein
MDVMPDFVKDDIGEHGIADGRDSHNSGALGNDVVNKQFDVSRLALPRLGDSSRELP